MPEYLSPGVYVEETSFRSKSIEGVATSTTGFAGMCRYGPVQYVNGPRSTEPRLITSFTEFERVYGGLEPIVPFDGEPAREAYLAHAARAFFLNGGRRLYVSRVFAPTGADPELDFGLSALALPFGTGDNATWRARWPGRYGNTLITVRPVRKRNCAYQNEAFGTQATALGHGAVVEITEGPAEPPLADADLTADSLAVVVEDPDVRDVAGRAQQTFRKADGGAVPTTTATIIKEIVLQVLVQPDAERVDAYGDLATHPAQRRWIGHLLQADDPEDEDAVVFLDTTAPDSVTRAIALMLALQTPVEGARLIGGNDGAVPIPALLAGLDASPDVATRKATGLAALAELEDVAIVALPDGGTYDDPELCQAAASELIGHVERAKYRIAVVDAPRASSMTEVRSFRGKFDTTKAAMYHPWIEVFDPLQRPAQGAPPRRILLPPSGFVTGIYARNDITRGVFKAPANEVVQGLTRFEVNINGPRNDVLNPEGINALRFFPGRGNRVWGARTMSSDPEWMYVNVRRLFNFLEHSIDRAMQYAVFEPNNERLWAGIRQSVEDFLYVQWLSGALLGGTPEEAFFVRCDRTTMTQNDLDNGRLICLIGVAPTKPAEFVIFRIGQFTADARA
ncbi:phage tail sheath subtilisin-like domain-containing protein [Actinoplanes sp. M2I2]|uniref:phage tail sheath family protein n=1 Tax=Actinoplanes sp. M2I2 TaxID=1734444 RepID=UPI00202295B0|nr:phage tail sheath subtilisin-like domain-containing protein [Actinoplanes sp. M2I2]